MSIFPNELLRLFSFHMYCWWHKSHSSWFVTIDSLTWFEMLQPSVQISQFHGFNHVQLMYSYTPIWCLNFHFAKLLSKHITVFGACTAFVQFTSIQAAAVETLKCWEVIEVKSWNHSSLNKLKSYIFPHLNVKKLMTLSKFQ